MQYHLKGTRDLILRKREVGECDVAGVSYRQVAEADLVTTASFHTAKSGSQHPLGTRFSGTHHFKKTCVLGMEGNFK